VRRAQHDRVRQALENQIVEVTPTAGDEAQILPALGSITYNRTHEHNQERGS
jgi:hypothetical protein